MRRNQTSAVTGTIEVRWTFKPRHNGRKRKDGPGIGPRDIEPGNVPRITRLMALAIKFDGIVRRGEVRDYADLARLGYVTRARITQIMNLLNLAPDIQSTKTGQLQGHTRWRTRGDERINRNNHPIRAGDVIGTHNGTIYNADRLFRRLRLRRFAEVDSELLFRLADRAFRDETPDLERFKRDLALCRGQITAVLAEERGWRPLPLEPMTMLVFRHESLMEFSRETFTFIAQGKRGKAP